MILLNECPQQVHTSDTVITIGTFDGVHLGHQKILYHLQKIKQQKKLQSIVFTFYPHPRKIVSSSSHSNAIKTLSTKEEKITLLQPYDIDYLIFCPFTQEFANIEPYEFVKYIAVHLNAKHIIIGYDHKFGKNRKGNINTFLELKNTYQYEVEQIPPETINEININSTKIRNYLLDGNIETANQLLGYNYFITGKVIEGKKLGSTIGIPTANILVDDPDKLIPANGVYCTTAIVQEKTYKAALNIGTNPTTDNDHKRKIEAHLINFHENIYHQNIHIALIKKIRDEKKFNSIEQMKTQILKDITTCQ